MPGAIGDYLIIPSNNTKILAPETQDQYSRLTLYDVS